MILGQIYQSASPPPTAPNPDHLTTTPPPTTTLTPPHPTWRDIPGEGFLFNDQDVTSFRMHEPTSKWTACVQWAQPPPG